MTLRFKQQGSLLITSLFVAIVLLALGLALTRVIEGGAQSNAVEYYGSKAFLSAQSGVEWKLTQLFPLNAPNGVCNADVPPNHFSATKYMENCQFVELSCSSVNNVADANSPTSTVTVYRITSTVSCDSGQWTTQRSLNVEAKTLN
ncbi:MULTISPECIES: hypothetical protein [Pseudoalteromonas]|uniref:hypothetical protein n=1 Tax=Pseudoalteromonas TaxID=53246 RepID=UPI00026C910B|nr:hypothetical protein [Pseudoalteromonas spongiae]ATC97575.1 MSHA biogenesis protein MshP [Pseudoalteromonas spongiae UST010723-006]